MTLAVAALFPWQTLREYLESLTRLICFQEGVILVSDSRWTYQDHHEDMGQKLWPLSPFAVAAYAGDVPAAEESLHQLRETCLRNGITRASEMAQVSSIIFRRVYNSRFGPSEERKPVYYLIGLFNRVEGASVIRISSKTRFHPLFAAGISIIGRKGAEREFQLRLKRAVERELVPDRAKSLLPEGWATLLAAVMHFDVIDKELDDTVGGPVQIAVVDGKGARPYGMYRLRVDEPIRSVKVSADIPELKQYRNGRVIPRLPSGSFDIEFYQVEP